MGYSHYFNLRETLTDLDWIKFVRTVEALDAHTDFKAGITFGPNSTYVVVDGGWEKLVIAPLRRGFGFCKTNYSEQDRFVVATLLIAKHAFGKKIAVSSDGNWSDWLEGRALFSAVTGITAPDSWLDESSLTEEELHKMAKELL